MSKTVPLRINGVKPTELAKITPKKIEAPAPTVIDEKVQNRAELARVYAGLLGANASMNDLIEAMTLARGDQDTIEAKVISDALEAIGLRSSVGHVAQMTEDHWPAIVQMTSGK